MNIINRLTKLFAILAIFFSSFLYIQSAQAAKRWVSIDEVAAGVIDPHIGADYADLILIGNLYDTLMWVSSQDLVPHLAESYNISSDGKTYTFKIKSGVKFHNGDVMTSEDVMFSFNRSMDIGLGYFRSSLRPRYNQRGC